MKTMKGPGIFLAQFAGDSAPFNDLKSIATWAAGHGYKGVQIPTWDVRLFDLKKAADSKAYCDEVSGICREAGVEITDLSTHLQGQLVAVHPAFDEAFDGFAAPEVRGNPKARQEWAVEQLKMAAKASGNFGFKSHVTFPGALAWPFLYPWPQRPAGLIDTAFEELAKRWVPILHLRDVPRGLQRPSALPDQLRPVAFRAADARLCRIHRHLSRADLRLSRQGRRVQSDGPTGRLFRFPALAEARRAVPLPG